MNVPVCPYCQQESELVTGDVVYPARPDLSTLYFWMCEPCGAWVGTHKNSKRHAPLGRLAGADLRRLKKEAHISFDTLWKQGGMSRTQAYSWLAKKLGLSTEQCHIGLFDETRCSDVIVVCTTAGTQCYRRGLFRGRRSYCKLGGSNNGD